VIGSARAVFVAGGIVPQLLDFLASSDFHAAWSTRARCAPCSSGCRCG
jgi:glucokinase